MGRCKWPAAVEKLLSNHLCLQRSNKIILNTYDQRKAGGRKDEEQSGCWLQETDSTFKIVLLVALEKNVLRVANDGFSSLHSLVVIYIYFTAPFCSVWFRQKAMSSWMSCIDWTQSSIRHREEGAVVLFPSPVQSCRHCRLSCRVHPTGFGSELSPPLPPLSCPFRDV